MHTSISQQRQYPASPFSLSAMMPKNDDDKKRGNKKIKYKRTYEKGPAG
jgi:hypothetical protein